MKKEIKKQKIQGETKMICGNSFSEKFLFFVFFLLFFSCVSGLSYEINQGSFSKEQFIDLNGFSSNEVSITLTAFPGNKEIDSFLVQPDENNFFSFKYFISCIDPAGSWTLILDDGEETIERMFSVDSSVRCEYLRVDFISPSSSSFFRKDVFDVRIKLTDAGENVANAEVYFWDFDGFKRRMYFEGNGIYFFEGVEIPVDVELKQTELMVVASSGKKENFGGSNTFSFEIRKVPINIELIHPLVKEFNFGKPLNLRIKPVYSADGSLVIEPDVWIEFNSQKKKLQVDSGGIFSLMIPTEDLNSEIFYVNVFVEDPYGNSGEKTFDFEPKGYLYFYIAQNAIVYIFPILFVIYIFFVSFKQGKIFLSKLFLKRKRKKLLILMKKLQDDYFNRQIISRNVYSEQYEDYKNELDALENELIELQKKQEIS